MAILDARRNGRVVTYPEDPDFIRDREELDKRR